ncbi:hypothetical protein QFZ77_002594 [Paenibacillus sp. V4I3]|uniref:hypothetical protein n=1 Tax=unclassified Paenibacillus TaxID=185978 RepID=UPI002789CF65|nr:MULTISPECIES: hypothetical protein [unclassified Paenibacillus]MDQ0873935.1 hypothetical protein [Paenibacillus sp. V4I3]MDQ0890188.1 hypothetical protein [Paenibacillus sp. V4I9]
MTEQLNEQELIQFIVDKSKADPEQIQLVLKYEKDYIVKAEENAKGEVDIDSDELIDHILGRPDVKLTELAVDTILEAEMDYLMKKGFAGYID